MCHRSGDLWVVHALAHAWAPPASPNEAALRHSRPESARVRLKRPLGTPRTGGKASPPDPAFSRFSRPKRACSLVFRSPAFQSIGFKQLCVFLAFAKDKLVREQLTRAGEGPFEDR